MVSSAVPCRGASLTVSGMMVTARQSRDHLQQQLEPWTLRHILLEPAASAKAQIALVAVPTVWSLLFSKAQLSSCEFPQDFRHQIC